MAVLDTSFVIALKRGDDAAVERLARLDDAVITPWVVAEYATAFQDPGKGIADLERAFTLVQTSAAWAATAAISRRRWRDAGRRIRHIDSWIATFAVHLHMPVVTRNMQDFEHLGVDVLTW